MRATPWYNGQRFSILVFYEWLIFIFGIIVLLVRRLAGQHFWSQMKFLILYRWRSFSWDRRCFCYCITRVPPGGDRDHWTPKWPQDGQTITERNHWVLNEVVTAFFIMCQLLFCSFYVKIELGLLPHERHLVERRLFHLFVLTRKIVTCCYYTWLTCLSICKYFKCETNVHFYQQRSCLINGLYPWHVWCYTSHLKRSVQTLHKDCIYC